MQLERADVPPWPTWSTTEIVSVWRIEFIVTRWVSTPSTNAPLTLGPRPLPSSRTFPRNHEALVPLGPIARTVMLNGTRTCCGPIGSNV